MSQIPTSKDLVKVETPETEQKNGVKAETSEKEQTNGVTTQLESFEGPEKLLEIWFVDPKELTQKGDKKEVKSDSKQFLRSVDRKKWEEALGLVRCKILNMVQNDQFDAYLLSESSLFVWPKKVILKTCGTTTLLLAMSSILDMARSVGLTYVGEVFYSRRNYFNQAAQLAPHSSFEDEVKFLDGIFEGSAYVLGKRNGDHWYLYLTDRDEYIDNSAPSTLGKRLPTVRVSKSARPMEPDYTLELLMTDLDEEVMNQFYRKPGATAKSVAKATGLADLFPDALLDDYLFDPCGYSLNGLLGDAYFTIHITPQPICSYASFETNIQCDYSELIKRVFTIFAPRNATATIFAGHITKEDFTKLLQDTLVPRLLEGRLIRRTYSRYEFENNYELAFAQYDHGRKRK